MRKKNEAARSIFESSNLSHTHAFHFNLGRTKFFCGRFKIWDSIKIKPDRLELKICLNSIFILIQNH
jgi:hypothetical protein